MPITNNHYAVTRRVCTSCRFNWLQVFPICIFNVFSLIFVLFLNQSNAIAAVSITEIQPLKFPNVVQNRHQNTVVVVNWNGTIGNRTNTTLLDSDYRQGKYLITSDTDAPISIDLFQNGNEKDVQLEALRIRYKNKTFKSFPAVELENPGVNGAYIEIGAKVVARKNTTAEQKYPQYTLIVKEK